MPKARKEQISLEATPYYHCVSRCVRRAFLCGEDYQTGTSYEHRRGWLEEKLLSLPKIFAIDIAAYAIMSNHYHVVLFINSPQAKSWTQKEVAERWHQLFSGNMFSNKLLKDEPLFPEEQTKLDEIIEKWRDRLQDISWFMRILNESIAREANKEDQCTGRFWEGRFKSQALLDESALLACMAYVDLNPVRAKMAKTPETSNHTSIKKRCEKAKKVSKTQQAINAIKQQVNGLHPFVGNPRQNQPLGIQMKLSDYLELVDTTGRILREDKRGAISQEAQKILHRLNIEENSWLEMTSHFEDRFSTFVGAEDRVRLACQSLDYQRTTSIGSCKRLLN